MNPDKKPDLKFKILKRVIICLAVIAAGFFLMNAMTKMKKHPEEKIIQEKALKVEALNAERQDIRVSISAYGEVASLNTVEISPEVSGLITAVHPRLEEGEVIPEGDVLFKIDSENYEIELETYTMRHKNLKSNMKLTGKE